MTDEIISTWDDLITDLQLDVAELRRLWAELLRLRELVEAAEQQWEEKEECTANSC